MRVERTSPACATFPPKRSTARARASWRPYAGSPSRRLARRAMPDLTGFLTDARGASVAARARRRRFDLLLARFPGLSEMRVLDLGGEAHTWQQLPARPREVVLLNIPWVADQQRERLDGADWIRPVAGDACGPPDEVR